MSTQVGIVSTQTSTTTRLIGKERYQQYWLDYLYAQWQAKQQQKVGLNG